jgi:hypothetical protein
MKHDRMRTAARVLMSVLVVVEKNGKMVAEEKFSPGGLII